LSVDDLRTWQGVVLGRAVSTLRSVETQAVQVSDVSYDVKKNLQLGRKS
jgi:hypothetical protein